MKLEPAVIVPVIAVLIAAVSTTIGFWSYRRDRLNQKIAAAKWQKEYFSDLVKWSDESMLLLSEALHLCDLGEENCEKKKFFEISHTLRVKLSAQIDKGRWFFPNYSPSQYDQRIEEAFRGYRHQILDTLVLAYTTVSELTFVDASKKKARETINKTKRVFTSEIQKVLAPRSRDAEFKKLTKLVGQP